MQPAYSHLVRDIAYNVFNRAYADPGAREHRQDVIPQAGRTFWLTLEQRL